MTGERQGINLPSCLPDWVQEATPPLVSHLVKRNKKRGHRESVRGGRGNRGWGGGGAVFHKTALPQEDQKRVSPFLCALLRPPFGLSLAAGDSLAPYRSLAEAKWRQRQALAACAARNTLCGRGSRGSPGYPLPRSTLPFGARALPGQIVAASRRGDTPLSRPLPSGGAKQVTARSAGSPGAAYAAPVLAVPACSVGIFPGTGSLAFLS